MDNAGKGAKALAASDSLTAVVYYTKALIEHPTSPDYLTQRSTAFTRLKPPRHDLALQDAELAVLCGQKRGKRDKIQAGQHRRVVTYYNMERYADAKLVLDSMFKWRPKEKDKNEMAKKEEMEHNMWTTKIDNKLKLKSQTASVKEYPEISLPDEKSLLKIYELQLKADGTFNYDGETQTEPQKVSPVEQSSAPTPVSTAVQKIRHEWYQNLNSVIITIYAKNVPKDRAEIDIEDDSVHIAFPHPSDPSATFTFALDPLFALIDSKSSTFAIKSTKVELNLAKASPGEKWKNLEGTEPLEKPSNGQTTIKPSVAAQATPDDQAAPAYPTSSKSGAKNWDKLARDLTEKKKEKKEDGQESGDDEYDSDYGGDAVDGFFKKLYKGADEETRRAMIKSFTESNGTALSTNWGEVGSKHVDEVQSKSED